MWRTEHTETTTAAPEDVWALWEDVAGWPQHDEGIEDVTLDGPFALGATGTLTPAGAKPLPFRLTAVEPGRAFSDVTDLPLAKIAFDHELRARPGGGCEIIQRVQITGVLSPFFALVLGRDVKRDMPGTMRALARRAEAA